jgi:tetratricopeptide (TPR) repeat protein
VFLNRRVFPVHAFFRPAGCGPGGFRAAATLGLALSLTVLVLAPRATADSEPALRLEASRQELYIGESFTLRVRVQNVPQPPEPDLSALAGARVAFLGSHDASSRTVIRVNRRVEVTERLERIFDYQVTPVTSGVFTAGPVRLVLPGRTLTAVGPAICVTDVHRQDLVALTVSASRTTVLLDEAFEVSLLVRIRALPPPHAETEPLFPQQPPRLNVPFLNPDDTPGLEKPNLTSVLDGLLVRHPSQPGLAVNRYTVSHSPFGNLFGLDPFGEPETARFAFPRRRVQADGKDYVEYFLTLSYRAVEEGAYTFGPVEFKGRVPTRAGPGGQIESEDVFAVGAACTVRVVPPPEQGRPETYLGTLGTGLVVRASLDTAVCRAGDPIALTLALSGGVRLDRILPPRLSGQAGLAERFEVYDDTVQTERGDGRITFTYTLRARQAGDLGVPSLAVSYFDTVTRQYETVHTDPIPLRVEPSDEVTSAHVVGGLTNLAAVQARTEDRRMRAPAAPWLVPGGDAVVSLWGGDRLFAVLLAGPSVFVFAWLIRLGRSSRSARRDRLRRRRALPRALARLAEFERVWARDPAAARAGLCDALRGFLADRFGAAAAGATPDDARRLLRDAGLTDEEAADFCRTYADLFESAFAAGIPGPGGGVPDFRALVRMLTNLDRAAGQAGRPRSSAGRVLPMLVLAFLAAGSALAARLADEVAGERRFLWQEANARMASARTAEDFREAAQTYARLASLGARNAPLFYNLGTAWLQAGHVPEAIAALERAERYQGAHPDLARNLDIALARQADAKAGVMPWRRIAFFWHYRLSCPTRSWIAALAYALCWLAGAVRMLWPRLPGVRPVLAMAALIAAVAGSSAVASLHQDAAAAAQRFSEHPAVPKPGTVEQAPKR